MFTSIIYYGHIRDLEWIELRCIVNLLSMVCKTRRRITIIYIYLKLKTYNNVFFTKLQKNKVNFSGYVNNLLFLSLNQKVSLFYK